MGFSDKAKNKTDEIKGKVKEAVGKATGNKRLQTAGKIDQLKAGMNKAGHKVKDALKGVLGK